MITTGSTSSYFGRSCSTGGVIAPHQKDNNLKLEIGILNNYCNRRLFDQYFPTLLEYYGTATRRVNKIEELVYTVRPKRGTFWPLTWVTGCSNLFAIANLHWRHSPVVRPNNYDNYSDFGTENDLTFTMSFSDGHLTVNPLCSQFRKSTNSKRLRKRTFRYQHHRYIHTHRYFQLPSNHH